VREAVQMYLSTRQADIATYAAKFKAEESAKHAQPQAQGATSADSKAAGPPNNKEKKGVTGDDN
jgi:hypothetical protein